MIFEPTKIIKKEFDEKGIKHQIKELDSLSCVEAAFNGDNCTCILRAISTDNNSVKILSDNLAKIPSDKLHNGFATINSLNNKYLYAKFCISNDGQVTAQYDIPSTINISDTGKIVLEIFLRFNQIIDDAYPTIMKTIWS